MFLTRLHYIVETGDATTAGIIQSEREETTSSGPSSTSILSVSCVSKYFVKTFAVENVSFDIAANPAPALLGGNGAGKTTVINMIRGEIKPNFGDIYLDGVSVLRQPQKPRLHIGICPQNDAIDDLAVRQKLRFYVNYNPKFQERRRYCRQDPYRPQLNHLRALGERRGGEEAEGDI